MKCSTSILAGLIIVASNAFAGTSPNDPKIVPTVPMSDACRQVVDADNVSDGEVSLKRQELPSSGAELEEILGTIVSINSPLGNLAGNLSTNLQVSLPPCKSHVPNKIGGTTLEPFNDSRACMRLAIRIETRSASRLLVRADVNYFDPEHGYAKMGAQWKVFEFQNTNGHWRFTKDLGGANK